VQNEPVSLEEAQQLLLPTTMAYFGSALLWLVCLALVVWSLVRLRRASSIVVAIALVAATAVLVWVGSTWAWVSSLVLMLVGFVWFRRPDALLSVVCGGMGDHHVDVPGVGGGLRGDWSVPVSWGSGRALL
jgi:hypothetical protein